jgi:hypothetical protein
VNVVAVVSSTEADWAFSLKNNTATDNKCAVKRKYSFHDGEGKPVTDWDATSSARL